MRLLLVEDNPADARWVREMLAEADSGVELAHVESLAGALQALRSGSFDILLLDLGLPDSTGPEQTLRQVIEASGTVPVVVLTGEDEHAGSHALALGAQDYLVKGQFEGAFLLRTLQHAVERQRLLSRLAREAALREEAQLALERYNDALAERVRMRTEQLQRVNRSLQLISHSNRTLLRAREEQTLLDEICRLVVDVGGYAIAWVGYAQDDADRGVRTMASAGSDTSCTEVLRFSWGDDEWGRGPVGTAIRSGRMAIERDVAGSESYVPWRAVATKRGIQASLALPLRVEGRVIGVLSICAQSTDMFEEDELELLEELAADLSYGIETLRVRSARREAVARARLLANAVEQTADLVTIADRDGNILYVNAAFEKVTGYSFEEALGKNPSILNSGLMSDTQHEELWRTIRGGEAYHGTFINRRKDGSLYYEQKTITPILRDGRGEITHFLSTGKDITNEVVVEDRLRQLSLHDPLTGLPNRGHMRERIARLLERLESSGGGVAVLVLNLDRFKVINHSLGHEGGDALLQAVAQRLLELVRPEDAVARLEADSFAVLLDDINTVDGVSPVADKLLAGFAAPFDINGEEVFVTVSMGVSVWPSDGDDAAALLQNAEVALSRAKQRGRARCEYYEPTMNAQAAKRLSTETSLRRALERGEFVLHYQPKVDIRTERIVGAEALVRWQHPERGLVPPGDFIPLLEDTGLIVPVRRWVLETACAQQRAWARLGGGRVSMAVNLSAQQFAQSDVVQMVEAALADCGMPGKGEWLELEITESAVMQDVGHAVSTLKRLKALGIRIAIDDFGTGHSSLSYLTRLPIDVLKVDRSFVIPLPHSQQDAEVVRAVLALARSLGLEVVAEGVESADQHAFLLEQGCTLAQGHYFAPPLRAEQIITLLAHIERPIRESQNR
ncbi:MAG: EAL domain-containing protein [Pseudomonadota bacterium]